MSEQCGSCRCFRPEDVRGKHHGLCRLWPAPVFVEKSGWCGQWETREPAEVVVTADKPADGTMPVVSEAAFIPVANEAALNELRAAYAADAKAYEFQIDRLARMVEEAGKPKEPEPEPEPEPVKRWWRPWG